MMEITLADQYYLKAADFYPWDMEQCLESIQYALSYDEEHVQAIILKAQIFMYQLKDYQSASRCFEYALYLKSQHPDLYRYYSLLLIWTGQLKKADEIISIASLIPWISKELIYDRRSKIAEAEGKVNDAINFAQRALLYSSCKQNEQFFKDEISRLKLKINKKRKKKKHS